MSNGGFFLLTDIGTGSCGAAGVNEEAGPGQMAFPVVLCHHLRLPLPPPRPKKEKTGAHGQSKTGVVHFLLSMRSSGLPKNLKKGERRWGLRGGRGQGVQSRKKGMEGGRWGGGKGGRRI